MNSVQETEPKEECRACNGPQTVSPDENIPLCNAHWNMWLGRYLDLYPGHDQPLPPCAAHRIQDLP